MTSTHIDYNIGVSEIRELTRAIQERYGFDFTNYALSSFRRRISRFQQLNDVSSTAALIKRVTEDRQYFHFFLKEITVNVTEMFRDPAFWRDIRCEVLPELAKRPRLRIWHAGCASGEEVYTMAIVLKETGLLDKTRILATDINEDVLEEAQSGRSDVRKMELNHRNYGSFRGEVALSDYYRTEGDYVQFDRDLLKRVEFQAHDLVQGQSPGAFDLVLCRNVLIYFNRELQNRVFQVFHNSLDAKGYLAIGSMESLDGTLIKEKYQRVGQENLFRKARP